MRGKRKEVANRSWLYLIPFLMSCGETPFYQVEPPKIKRDNFTGKFTQEQDFLFVFDNSGSMREERDQVKQKLNDFVNRLHSRRTVSYRMALTTTDKDTFNGEWVSSDLGTKVVKNDGSIPDPVVTFQSIIQRIPLESAKSYWEQGLEAAKVSLETYGSQLMRVSVPLAVLFFSDEQDWSYQDCGSVCNTHFPEDTIGRWTWFPEQRYVNYFKGLKRGENTIVSLYPIVYSSDFQCNEGKSFGTRYLSVLQGVGNGLSGSICNTKLDDSFTRIASQISDRGICFGLSTQAVNSPEDFVVKVDGKPISFSKENGFFYEASSNSVCFAGSVAPTEGSQIEVEYPY